MAISFSRDFEAPYEAAVAVSPLIRRVLARNPGPFTFKGTGTAIIGHGAVAVIDPGPDDPGHLEGLRAALKNETVSHILVTHTHRDHSPAARALKTWTGAKTYGFGPHGGGARVEGPAVEAGADMDFVPDVALRDGDVLEGAGFTLEAVHTPGHTSNHLCFALREERSLFTGDHVMGWSTSVVAPPDGDMGAYMESLRLLLARDDFLYWPTHGGAIPQPKACVSAYLTHRLQREAAILAAVHAGIGTVPALVERLYVRLDARLVPAARLSVLAHLIFLIEKEHILSEGPPTLDARFRFVS